jgi:uncharacterized membrane protein
MGAAIIAIATIRERQTAEAFERAGATSPARARSLDVIGVAAHGIGWRRLNRHAVVREASPGLYYLDVPSWQAARTRRRKLSIILVLVILILAGVIAYLASRP